MSRNLQVVLSKQAPPPVFRMQLRRSLLLFSLLAAVIIVPPVGKGADAYFSLATTQTFLRANKSPCASTRTTSPLSNSAFTR